MMSCLCPPTTSPKEDTSPSFSDEQRPREDEKWILVHHDPEYLEAKANGNSDPDNSQNIKKSKSNVALCPRMAPGRSSNLMFSPGKGYTHYEH